MTKQNNDNPSNSGELKNTQPTKTGEQMLIELGFEKIENSIDPFEIYSRPIANSNYNQWLLLEPNGYVFFEAKGKYQFSVIPRNNKYVKKIKFANIDTQLHKAIHQCLLDFGWLKE